MHAKQLKHSLGLAAIYGAIHAFVDGVTVTTTFAVLAKHAVPPEAAVFIILMYDLIAFTSQPFLGFIADRFKDMRGVTGLGITLCLAGGLLVPTDPYVAAIVAGIGNALFHLGAGVISMSIRPGRAAAPGVFVGPGTLGLAFGIYWGRFADSAPIPLMLLLGLSLLVPILAPHPEKVSARTLPPLKTDTSPKFHIAGVALLLLMISILFRSMVGHAASHACPKHAAVLFGLAGAGCLGKICGGLLSDKLGWIKISVGALVLAGPLIAFGGANPYVIGLGGGLFQMTMPVTLVAAGAILPNRPALVFGLNCLFFAGGAIPVFAGILTPYYSSTSFLLVTIAAVIAVFGGLYFLTPHIRMKFETLTGAVEKA